MTVVAHPATIPRLIVWRPALFTLLLHGILLYVLTLNWTLRDAETVKPVQKPRHIQARLIEIQPAKPKTRPRAQPAPRAAARKPAPSPRPAVKQAAPKPAPAKPKPVEQPQPVETSRPTAEQRAAAAREELALAMQAEDQLLEEATDQQITDSYVALIARVIEDNWSRPPSARNNMEAELVLQLIPTGEVVSVTVARSSGLPAFDRSAVLAVEKAERFPELQDLPPRIFNRDFRTLRLKFKPEDLRY